MGGGREGKVGGGSRGTDYSYSEDCCFRRTAKKRSRPRGPVLRVFSLYAVSHRTITTSCETKIYQ